MNEKEVIERLNRFKTIKVLYGNTFSMHLEQLEQLQNDIETVLNLLEKKDKIIDLMAKELVKAHEWFYSEFDNYTKEDFIKYFENKQRRNSSMEEDKEILYLLDIAINSYIENDILRLDVSDTTKNRLKRDLRKKFRDKDFIYDIKNNIGLIPKSKVKEKIEELKNGTYDAKIILQQLLED